MASRVSLQPRHVTNRLPEKQKAAVVALEHHLWLRHHRDNPSLETLDDGAVGVFLTLKHFQRCLRETGSRWKGRDFAAECLNTILPALGLIEDTGLTKKPKAKPSKATMIAHAAHGRTPPTDGGRHAQTSPLRSFWWRVYRLPTLTRYVRGLGAYASRREDAERRAHGTASLFRLLRCQGLVSQRPKRKSFQPGSVQWQFQHYGPP
jgi:hypothetical protein